MSLHLNLDEINKQFDKAARDLQFFVAVYVDGTANVICSKNRKDALRTLQREYLHDLKRIKPMNVRVM